MKLLQLILKNFKGVRKFILDAQGQNVNVFGDNATGKTTLFDSLTWLLFDKDSQNKKDFDIKTLDENNQPYHGLDHEVEATFDVDGKQLTLRKVYSEKWTKKKGAATQEFTGHTTDYFIDGVPAKKKEFAETIASIADEEIFKLLTNPAYFNSQLHWQDRRKILLEVCGDITYEEVIASDSSLSKLPEILNGRKLEDHRKVIAAKRAEVNKELEKIPVRIDEVHQSLPDVSGIQVEELTEKMAFLKSRAQEKTKEISRIKSGGEIAERTKALREIEGRVLEIKNQHRSEVDDKIRGKRNELSKFKDDIFSLQQKIKQKQFTVNQNDRTISELNTDSERLRNEWFIVNDRQFEHNQECTCPTCGQQLPEEQWTKAREKALATFNLEKSQILEGINAKGKQLKADIERLQSENYTLGKEITAIHDRLRELEQKSADLQIEIDEMVRTSSDITENLEYIQALKEKEAVNEQIEALKKDNSGLVVMAETEIASLEVEIATLEKTLAHVDQYKRGQKRIDELKLQERELATEFEKLEGELYLTEQFIRSKVAMLEKKINSQFKLARFKLFDVQINGGVVECCETMYQGVPYTSLNNAARINVGLDIINTLSDHYSFTAPIFIDNAEAVTKLIETKGQVINLIVSGADKKLRIEYKTAMKEAV